MSGVAVASHISCITAFSIVTLILVGHQPTRSQFPRLITCCGVSALWALFVVLNVLQQLPPYYIVQISEILSQGLWISCITQMLRFMQRGNKKRWFLSPGFSVVNSSLLCLLAFASLFPDTQFSPTRYGAYAQYSVLANLLIAILILTLVEQLYRGSTPEKRGRIQLFCIGVGLMASYDIYLYSHTIIGGKLNGTVWALKAAMFATAAPLIGLSALRHAKWHPEILPSRALIFRSTVLLSCGIYLLCMAVMGLFIRQWGGLWGQSLQILFLAGALLLLVVMFSSEKIRASAKLFVAKNFFKLRYDYREEWIRFSNLLSSEAPKKLPHSVIKALAQILDSPRGILFEWEDKRGYVLKDCWNTPFPAKDMVIEPCAFTDYCQQFHQAIELPMRFEAEKSLPNLPLALREFAWRWLLVPLMHGNRLHAFVILAHPEIAFFNLNWEVVDLLSMAGRQAAICLAQEKNAQALAIARQFEGYNRLSAFVIHDLKNVSAQLHLAEANREKHAHNPAFINSVFHTIEHAKNKIDSLAIQLRSKNTQHRAEEIALAQLLKRVIALCSQQNPVPRLVWQLSMPEITLVGDREAFSNVLCHLIENAQQATASQGKIWLIVKFEQEKLVIAIQDSGCGMDPEFIHLNLYQPFVTTKGEKGMGIGVFEAREYLDTVGGKLHVETQKGQGTTFSLEFPHASILSEIELADYADFA